MKKIEHANSQGIIISIFLFLCCILVSCKADLVMEITMPPTEEKLVVESTFTPFTPPHIKALEVQVWKSSAILDTTKTQPITDARVELYENGELLMQLGYNTERGAYVPAIFYFPSVGHNYQVKVFHEGLIPITANTTIPDQTIIKESGFIAFAGLNSNGFAYSSVSITFPDRADNRDFYEIIVESPDLSSGNPKIWTNDREITGQPWYPPVFSFEAKLPDRLLLSDKHFNGQQKTVNFYFVPAQLISRGKLMITPAIYNVFLRSVTEEYYRYYSTLMQHKNNQRGDTFYGLGEMVNVYSNIENGYGIFAGYNNSAVTFTTDTLFID